jgi:hypothetical protein
MEKFAGNWRFFLSLGLAIAPAFLLAYFLIQFTVNVPLLDEWVIARLLPQVRNGTATFTDFFSQFNEHRIFFPRLIIVAMAFFTGWDLRYENLFAFLVVCLISLNLNRLRQITLGLENSSLILLVFTNVLIFSLAQWENWLVGLYLKYFLPIACLTLGILICDRDRQIKTKAILCGILATISTFSIANGILLWLLFLPLLFSSWSELKRQINLVIIWILAFGLNLYLYFADYRSPYAGFDLFYPLSHPLAVLHYFLVFLGSPLAFGSYFSPMAIATTLGLVMFSLFLLVCAYIWQHPLLWRRSMGWLAIAFYSLGSDLVVAVGRIYSGVEQALTSRYSTFALYFIVALLHLLGLAIAHFNSQTRHRIQWMPKLVTFALTILLLLHFQTTLVSAQTMSSLRLERLQGKACLQAMNLIDTSECIKLKNNPKPTMVKERGNKINQSGFLNPPLIASPVLINPILVSQTEQYGWFDRLEKISDRQYQASGWAILPNRREPADAVFLAYENPKGEEVLFKIVVKRTVRPDVAKSLGQDYLNAGWEGSFSLDDLPQNLPQNTTKISAYAYDTDTGESFPLNLARNPGKL